AHQPIEFAAGDPRGPSEGASPVEPSAEPPRGKPPAAGDHVLDSRNGWSAAAIAAADFHRSRGCFSSDLRSTASNPSGTSGRNTRSGTGGCSRIIVYASGRCGLKSRNGNLPVSI